MSDSRRAARQDLAALLIALLGLVIRLSRAVEWNARHANDPSRLRYGDEPSYDAPARALFDGDWFTAPDRLPLYPLWLAFWHAVSDFDYDIVVYAQAVLGAGAVWLTYALGRRLADRDSALIAAGVAALSPVLVQQTLYFIPAGMFTVAIGALTLALVRAWQQPSLGRFVAAGLLVGIANLIRPTFLFLPIFVAVALIAFFPVRRTAVRYAAAYLLAAYLVTTPWTVRNWLVYDTFLPLSTSNATLWLGSPEYHRLIHDQGYTYTRVWDEIIYPDDPSVPYPTSVEGEQYWSERGLRSIRQEPLLYARLVAERLATFWVGDPVVDWGGHVPLSYSFLRRHMSPADALVRLAERALPILAAGAVLILWRRRRELLPLYVVLLYATLLHAATVARVRMSDPFRPLLLVLVAAAVVTLYRAARHRGATRPSVSGLDLSSEAAGA